MNIVKKNAAWDQTFVRGMNKLIFVAIGVYGLLEKRLDIVILKVVLLLLMTNFLFCYLML